MLTQKQTAGSKTAVKPNSACSVWLHLNPWLLLQKAIQHNLKLTDICISIAVKSGKENQEGDKLGQSMSTWPALFFFLTTPQVIPKASGSEDTI